MEFYCFKYRQIKVLRKGLWAKQPLHWLTNLLIYVNSGLHVQIYHFMIIVVSGLLLEISTRPRPQCSRDYLLDSTNKYSWICSSSQSTTVRMIFVWSITNQILSGDSQPNYWHNWQGGWVLRAIPHTDIRNGSYSKLILSDYLFLISYLSQNHGHWAYHMFAEVSGWFQYVFCNGVSRKKNSKSIPGSHIESEHHRSKQFMKFHYNE